MIKKLLGKAEIEDIIWGATIFSSGGGGSPSGGFNLLKGIDKKVTLVEPTDVHENENAVMVAGIGAPRDPTAKTFGPEAVIAYEAIKNIASIGGIQISYIMAGEVGGVNSITPLYIGAQKDISVVDADGCGRAVPTLGTTLYSIYKIPASPIVIANRTGDVIVTYLDNPFDTVKAEIIARTAVVSFGMVGAFSTWIVNMATIKKYLVTGSTSRSQKIGKAIREAKSSGKDVVKEIIDLTDGKELLRGKIRNLETKIVAGHDFARTTIEGNHNYKGKTLIIDAINESIIAWQDGKPVIMSPDLITIVTIIGEPLTNADTKVGMEVAVVGIPAAEPWKRTADGYKCWKEVFQRLSYDGPFISPF
jgi:DUF917 family protein